MNKVNVLGALHRALDAHQAVLRRVLQHGVLLEEDGLLRNRTGPVSEAPTR